MLSLLNCGIRCLTLRSREFADNVHYMLAFAKKQ
jgi:hypothetical protein